MKNTLILLITTFLIFGCEKKEVLPDNTQYITGSYIGFQINAEGNSVRLPYNGLRASALIGKAGYNKVQYAFNLSSPNSAPLQVQFNCQVVKISSNSYQLIDEATQIKVADISDGYLVNKILGQDIIVFLSKQ